jgi:hypothetical protein
MKHLSEIHAGLPPEERTEPLLMDENRLASAVPVVLEGISLPKYQRL